MCLFDGKDITPRISNLVFTSGLSWELLFNFYGGLLKFLFRKNFLRIINVSFVEFMRLQLENKNDFPLIMCHYSLQLLIWIIFKSDSILWLNYLTMRNHVLNGIKMNLKRNFKLHNCWENHLHQIALLNEFSNIFLSVY